MATVITIGLQTDTRARKEIVDALVAAERQATKTGDALLTMKDKAIKAATATADLTAKKKELQNQLSATTTRSQADAEAIGRASRAVVKLSGDINAQKGVIASAQAEMKKYTAEQLKTDVNAKLAAKAYRDEVATLTTLKKALGDARQSKRELTTATGAELKEAARLKGEIISLTAAINANQKAEAKSRLEIRATTLEAGKQRSELTNLKREMKETERASRGAAGGQRELNTAMIAGGVAAGSLLYDAITKVFSMLKSIGTETVLYAARNIELAIAMENVARVNGMTAGEIYAHEKAIRRLNISTQETREVLTKFAQAELDVGKAAQLARAAQDLAVIAGADSAETFERLTQGITTLQIRVLRTAGVYVSLDASLDKAAKTSGRARDSFSEQEKQAILLEQVLNFAARATGTYEASMTSASKQMRSMQRLWNDLKDAMGQFAQGALLVVVRLLGKLLEAMAKNPAAVWVFIAAITALGVKLLWTLGVASSWVTAFGKATVMAIGFARAQDNITRSTAAATEAMAAQSAVGSAGGIGMGAAGAGGMYAASAPVSSAAMSAGAYRAGGRLGLPTAARAASGGIGVGAGEAVGGGAAAAGAGVSAGALLSWALLAAAIGAVIYLIYKMVTATKTLEYSRDEDAKLAIRQIKVSQEDAAALRKAAQERTKMGAAYKMTDELRKTELLALGRVNEARGNDIRKIDDETQRYRALAGELDNYIRLKKEELVTSATNDVDAFRSKNAGRGIIENNISEAQRRYNREQAESANLTDGGLGTQSGGSFRRGAQRLWSFVSTGSDLAESSAKAMRDYKIQLETLDEEQKQMVERWADSATAMGKNSEQFLALIPNISKGSEEYEKLNNLLSARLKIMAADAKINQGAISFTKAYNKAIDELRISEFDFQNTQAGRTKQADLLNQRMQQGVDSGLAWNEVVAGNRDAANALQLSLQRASTDQESFNAKIATFTYQYGNDFLKLLYEANGTGDKSIETFGEGLARTSQRLYDVQTRLKNATREIYDLMDGGGEAGRLEGLESSLQVFRREIDEIINLRRDLGNETTGGISDSREARLREIAELKSQTDVRDSLRENIYAQMRAENELAAAQGRTAMSLVDSETIAATMIANNIQKRREEERDLHADLIRMSVERQDMITDEGTAVFNSLKKMYVGEAEGANASQQRLIDLRARRAFNAGDNPFSSSSNGTLAFGNLPGLGVGESQLLKRPVEIQIEHLQNIAANTSATGAIVAAIAKSQPGGDLNHAPASAAANNLSATGLTRGATAGGDSVAAMLSNILKSSGNDDATIAAAVSKLEGRTAAFKTSGSFSQGGKNYSVKDMVDYIVRSTVQNGLDPAEALNQAMRESSFNPFAQGRDKSGNLSGASGLFQFIGSTGNSYGFKGIPKNSRDFSIGDERYDPFINTDKRNQYMKDLLGRTKGNRQAAYDLYVGKSVGGNMGSNYSGGIVNGGKNITYDVLGDMAARGAAMPGAAPVTAAPSFDVDKARSLSATMLGNPFPFREMESMRMNRIGNYDASKSRDDIGESRDTYYKERTQDLKEMRLGTEDGIAKFKVLSDMFDTTFESWAESSEQTYRQIGLITSKSYREWFDSEERRASVAAGVDLDVLKSRDATTDRLIEIGRREEIVLDPSHRIDVWREAEAARRDAALSTTDDIIRLEYQLENAQLGMSERVKKARLEAMLEVRNKTEEAYASIERSNVNMADADVVHTERIQASIAKWGEAQKGKDQIISDAITGAFDATFSVVDKGLDKLTSRMGAFGSILKSVLGDLIKLSLSRVFMSMLGLSGTTTPGAIPGGGGNAAGQSAGSMVGSLIGGLGKGIFGGASSTGGSMPSSIAMNSAGGSSVPSLFNMMAGGGGNNATGMMPSAMMGGGIPSAAAMMQNNGGLFGGMSQRATSIGSPASNGIGTSIQAGGFQVGKAAFGSLFNSTSGAASFGKDAIAMGGVAGKVGAGKGFGFGNGQFAAMLPFLGASIGGSLGGSSRLGGILGTAGGALAGIGLMGAPAALLAGGSMAGSLGFLAPLFSNPLTAIAGGALLIGAVLLGRNAARRRDETTRDKLTGDSRTQLNKLLDAVNRDKISAADALGQAEGIRAEYMTQAGQLKDKKTREHALATVRELDYIINQIKSAGVRQEKRQELDSKLVPEFASGIQSVSGRSVREYASAASQMPKRGNFTAGEWFESAGKSQVVAGRDYGFDSVPAALRPGEMVMNNTHQSHLRAIAGNDIFRRLGIPAMESGGYVQPSSAPVYNTPTFRPSASSTSIKNDAEQNIYLTFDEKFADEAVKRGGGRVIKIVGSDLDHDGVLKAKIKK